MVEEARLLYNWCLENELYEDCILCLHRMNHLQPELGKIVEKDLLLVLKKHIEKLEHLELWENIARCFQKAFTFFPNCGSIHYELGCFLHRTGNVLMAITEFKTSLSLNPDNLEAELCLENAKSQAIDQWHFRMLNDKNRNEQYKEVIKQELQKCNHSCILDIGTGTGILAMIGASKCGTVYACDSSNVMFQICSDVLQANKLSENIALFNKSSLNLNIPNDIPSKVSLVITEIFDAGLLGESALTTLNHAWEKLLLPPPTNNSTELNHPHGKIIPQSATVFVCLVECEWLRKSHRVIGNTFGPIDLSSLTIKLETDEPYNSEYLSQLPGGYKMLSKPQALCKINFNSPINIRKLISGCNYDIEIQCTEIGFIDCVALWFDLELNEQVSLSTAAESNSCWEQAIFPVTDIFCVSKNDRVALNMTIKEHIAMKSLSLKGHSDVNNIKYNNRKQTLYLKSEWIRKLNNNNLATCLQSSLECEFRRGNFCLIDHQTVPLAALLAMKMTNAECTITNKEISEKFLDLCAALEILTQNLSFLDIEELCDETPNSYDVIFYDPIQLSGVFHENILQDVALLKQNFLQPLGSIYPSCVSLLGMAVDCPTFNNYWKVKDENVLNFKIAHVMNNFQTRYQEDVHFRADMGKILTSTVPLMRLSTDDAFANNETTSSAAIKEAGLVSSFIYWAELLYGNELILNTRYSSDLYNLGAFSPLLNMELQKDDELRIKCSLVGSAPQFHIEGVKKTTYNENIIY